MVSDKHKHVSTLVRHLGGTKSPINDEAAVIRGLPVCLVYDADDEGCKEAGIAGWGQRYFQYVESRVRLLLLYDLLRSGIALTMSSN